MQSDRARTSRRPWWVWLIGAVFLALGTVIVVAGGRLSGLSDYERSIFAHVGTAIALIGPLFIGGKLLEIRVREVGAEASAARQAASEAKETAALVRESVSTLDREVRDRLAEIRREDEQRADRAARGSFQDLVDLYEQAAARYWIDRLGVRVPAGPDMWLRVRAVRRAPEGTTIPLIELTYEDPKLQPIASAVWSADEHPAQVFVRLAEGLKGAGRWPGDAAFSVDGLLTEITSVLLRIIESHTGPSGERRLRSVIELVGNDWAVTRQGLDSLDSANIYADHTELLREPDDVFQRIERRVEAEGLDAAAFRAAFSSAERIHAALKPDYGPIGDLGRRL
jgi:hypothetical protein